jgi:hypothetical protein
MANKVKPVSPSELNKEIPDVVIEAVNQLLQEKNASEGSEIILYQKDIVSRIKNLDSEMTSEKLFKKGYMDFEPLFEKAGWKVYYDKPGYCESYEPTFTFTPKKNKK